MGGGSGEVNVSGNGECMASGEWRMRRKGGDLCAGDWLVHGAVAPRRRTGDKLRIGDLGLWRWGRQCNFELLTPRPAPGPF
jgi:hypothetical protein